MKPLSLIALFFLGAIWGASFPFIKMGLESFGPMTIVALRLGGGALLLSLVLRYQGQHFPAERRVLADMLLVGAVGMALPFSLIGWGEQYINSGLAAILIAVTPLFTLLLAYVWTREERLDMVRSLGVVLGFLGVAVAVDITDINVFSASVQAQIAVLLAAVCYAFVTIYGRRAFRGLPALVSANGTMLGGALCITPLALLVEGWPTLSPDVGALTGVVGLTVLSTALAYILFYWTLERIGSARTSMVTYLVPMFALVFGWLWLGETIGLHTVLGLALVIAGIMIANRVSFWRRSAASSATHS